MRAPRQNRGFTLIELMVVIAIVSVLAVIAVVAYRSVVNASHVSEATHMIQAIRGAQEAYHSETQIYANVSTALQGTPYPASTPKFGTKTAWGGSCNGCNGPPAPSWADLNVHVDGPVMFGYTTIAGVSGVGPTPASVTVNGVTASFPAKPASDWFIIGATCDVNGDGSAAWDSTKSTNVYGSSFTNEIWVGNEGQ